MGIKQSKQEPKKIQNNISSCKKCGKEYTNVHYKWCKPCHINNFEKNFEKWTSGNENIDNFVQQMQLKISRYNDIIIEWIPYNQFNDIKEIGKGGFATVYSAIWKDGPLSYDRNHEEYIRTSPYKDVALKCLHNSQNITIELLNEVWNLYEFNFKFFF
jgi:hypothetical protein